MATEQYSCPSCGGPLTLESRFSKMVICPYCGQTCLVSAAGLDPTGQTGTLADFPSMLAIGAKGTLRGEPFHVLGRLRYKYDDGFWDEWFIQLGGRFIWLQEDEGTFTSFAKETITAELPAFGDIQVGKSLNVNGRQIFVTEKNEAMIAGGEGELRFSIKPGERVDYVDGTADGKVISIEFAPDEINLSVGEAIPFEQVSISKDE